MSRKKATAPEPAPNTAPEAIAAHKARKAAERAEQLKGVDRRKHAAPGNAGYPVEPKE